MDKQKYLDKGIKLEEIVKSTNINVSVDDLEKYISDYKLHIEKKYNCKISRVSISFGYYNTIVFHSLKTEEKLEQELKSLTEKQLKKIETSKKISEGLKKYWIKEKEKIRLIKEKQEASRQARELKKRLAEEEKLEKIRKEQELKAFLYETD